MTDLPRKDALVLDHRYFMGHVNDLSGQGNHGVLTGCRFAKRPDQHLHFSGTDRVTVADAPELQLTQGTIIVYGDFEKYTSSDRLVSKRDGGGTNYDFYFGGVSILALYDGTHGRTLTGFNLGAKSVTISFADGEVAKGYRDGVLVGNLNGVSAISVNDAPLSIGSLSGANPNSNPLKGALIWNVPLTATEIAQAHAWILETSGPKKMVTRELLTPVYWDFSTTDTTQSWTFAVKAGTKYIITWGDGGSDVLFGNGANQVVAHNYAAAGTYQIRFWIENQYALLHFRCNSNSLTGSIPSLDNNPALQDFLCYSNSLSGSIPDLSSNPALAYFYCYSNSLTGSIPDLSNSPALVYFLCCSNSLSGTIPSLSSNPSLGYFHCYSNSLTGYTASTIAATCTNFQVQINALSLEAVDQILTDFTTGAAGRPAAGKINLSGGTNSPPTPAVKATCVSALPGWTIDTN